MTILITGATGLIGHELEKLLLSKGITVNYLSTSKRKLKNNLNNKGFYWNPKTGEIDMRAFENVEVIFHFAGASIANRWTKKYKVELIESRVLSTRLLFETLKNNPNQVRQVIAASAIGGYASSYTKIYHENDPLDNPGFIGDVVRNWENEVNLFESINIKVAKVRIGLVLSTKGGMLMKLIQQAKLGIASSFGSGKQYQSWIHIDDLVQIFDFIYEHQEEGVFNGVAPHPTSNNELIKSIAKSMHKPFFMPNVPSFVLKLVLGEMHLLLLESQHVSCLKLLDKGFQFKYASLQKALLNLIK